MAVEEVLCRREVHNHGVRSGDAEIVGSGVMVLRSAENATTRRREKVKLRARATASSANGCSSCNNGLAAVLMVAAAMWAFALTSCASALQRPTLSIFREHMHQREMRRPTVLRSTHRQQSGRRPVGGGRTVLFLASTITGEPMSSYNSASSFPEDVVRALDLLPVIEEVASHCGTYRGRQALLRTVGAADDQKQSKGGHGAKSGSIIKAGTTSRRQRLAFQLISNNNPYDLASSANHTSSRYQGRLLANQQANCPIASSATDAVLALETVAQAAQCIQSDTQVSAASSNDSHRSGRRIPPLYPADSGPCDISTVTSTDDDEWLDFISPIDQQRWTLEHLLQAEQVVAKLIKVHEWSLQQAGANANYLKDIGACIAVEPLRSLRNEIGGTVEITRARTVQDPTGRSSYQFTLSERKFPVLAILRERRNERLEQLVPLRNGKKPPSVSDLEDEIAEKESLIQSGLVQAICAAAQVIDDGLNTVAQLDVVFAKAAFGLRTGACDTTVLCQGQRGTIDVKQFVHPLLRLQGEAPAVPIDLLLGSSDSSSSAVKNVRCRLISGPNGGGKTIAMKSFGLVSIMTKLGIPVAGNRPVVDFFDEVLVSVGDLQDVQGGESTFTAQLNRYSSLIEQVGSNNSTDKSHLVLLDELGGGTEESAGGAIGQAVLEKLLETESCRVVATTHSPLLKTLSFTSSQIGCAAVLLENEGSALSLPSYRLEYNCIGESHAFGAASRCSPPLPDNVLRRASSLMINATTSGSDGEYMRALAESLEHKVALANERLVKAEQQAHDATMIRNAMLSLATAYEEHFASLEQRVEGCYQEVVSATAPVDVLGDTLAELRIVRERVKSETELLRERGLKRIPDGYELSADESVVVVDESSDWNGSMGLVVAKSDTLAQLSNQDVAVFFSAPAWDRAASLMSKAGSSTVVLRRYQLAVWDYDSVWDGDPLDTTVKSVPDSKRRLNTLLSTLKAKDTSTPITESSRTTPNRYTSSRERKAAKRKKKR